MTTSVRVAPEPYFERPGPPGERGHLLVISPLFPPNRSVGALRWRKLGRYAAERGFTMDVVARDPAGLSNPDPGGLEDLPPGIRAFGVARPRPFAERVEDALLSAKRRLQAPRLATREGSSAVSADARKRKGLVEDPTPTSFHRDDVASMPASPRSAARAWWAWRDAVRGSAWADSAVRLGLTLASERAPSAVVSCGPPHHAHVAGRRLSRALGVPFIVDMRDPWSLQERLPERLASPLWYRIAGRRERNVVDRAALVVCNTDPFREAMERRHRAAADRFLTVLNGYDDEEIPGPVEGRRFVIAFAGTIYIDRDPRPVFEAAARAIEKLELTPAQLGIELIGRVKSFAGASVEGLAADVGIAEYVETVPFLPRAELLERLANASLLVSLPQDSDLAIPSKVYEYMRYPAWLLALAEPSSATGLLLRNTHAHVVRPGDVAALADVLLGCYGTFKVSGRPTPIADAPGGERFSRRAQAAILFDAIETLLTRASEDDRGAGTRNAPASARPPG